MPPRFGFPTSHQLWMPLRLSDDGAGPRAGAPVIVFGRLLDGVTPESAQSELQTLTTSMVDAETANHLRATVLPSWHLTFGFPSPGGLRALPEFAPMLIILLFTMIGVVIATVHYSLRPLREVSQQAAGLSGARISERLRVDRLPREVVPLVQAVNQALDRLEVDYKAQRDFTANAAHELRTPLAVLRADLDSRFTPQQLGAHMKAEHDKWVRVIKQTGIKGEE